MRNFDTAGDKTADFAEWLMSRLFFLAYSLALLLGLRITVKNLGKRSKRPTVTVLDKVIAIESCHIGRTIFYWHAEQWRSPRTTEISSGDLLPTITRLSEYLSNIRQTQKESESQSEPKLNLN